MKQGLWIGGAMIALCGMLVTTSAPARAGRDNATGGNGRLTMMDAHFVHAAALGDMMEIDLGQMAQDKATRDDVKAFARRMVDDHTRNTQDLRTLATQKGITLPMMMPRGGDQRGDRASDARNDGGGGAAGADGDLGPGRADLARLGLRHLVVEHQEMRRMLASLSGQDFDRAYLGSQVKAHSKMAAMYELKSKDATDSDVRSFAGNKLPIVMGHKSMARRLAGLGSDSDSPRRSRDR